MATESTPLTSVPGVGQTIAEALRDVGIASAEDLVEAEPERVMRAEGIGRVRAEKLIENAASAKKDISATYNAYKHFEGRKYTGVRIGRGHKWYYQEGVWKEKKVTPDRWEFSYAVNKRRAGKAPVGSGVPLGTQYHWYIVAHQIVDKLDANTYTTDMAGLKFKLAHKRADTAKWNASDAAQRKKLIKFLKELIADLEEHD